MVGGLPTIISAFFQVPIYGLFSAKVCCNMQWCTFKKAVIREKQIKNSAFYHFLPPIYGENMYFCQKIAEKKSLKFFEIDHMYFCPKIRFTLPKKVLNVKILANFTFSSFSPK